MLISKTITVIFYIAMTDSNVRNEFNSNYPQVELPSSISASIIMSTVLLFIQSYIACYVRKYYYLLPKSGEKRHFIARALPVHTSV